MFFWPSKCGPVHCTSCSFNNRFIHHTRDLNIWLWEACISKHNHAETFHNLSIFEVVSFKSSIIYPLLRNFKSCPVLQHVQDLGKEWVSTSHYNVFIVWELYNVTMLETGFTVCPWPGTVSQCGHSLRVCKVTMPETGFAVCPWPDTVSQCVHSLRVVQ
jgi:hypothetical protein